MASGTFDCALPAPATNLSKACEDLATHGLCIIQNAMDADLLKRVREATYHAARTDPSVGKTPRFGLDAGDGSQRVWGLLNRDPVFAELVEHPIALRLVKETIGWPALLSNISANITSPGGGEGFLHTDQQYMPEPWSRAQGINLAWCVDDFTEDNGATLFVPGSPSKNRVPGPEDADAPAIHLTAPAGSLCAFEGRMWHKTGINRTANERRAGIFAWYTLPIYLPQENWYLSLNRSYLQFGSPTLLQLLGYTTAGFGKVNGLEPLWRYQPEES